MALAELHTAHDPEAPSGENLEYEQVFTDLTLAAQRGQERQAGDDILPAEDPDFGDITDKALAVLGQSHDLRAAVLLAEAAAHRSGISGFADALDYLRFCLEEHWETCHPQLDTDDDDDPTERVNALLGLADGATILRALRQTPLTKSQMFGRITLRDIMIADGELTAPEDASDVKDASSIAAAFKDTDADALADTLQHARSAIERVDAINATFDAHIPGRGPDLGALTKMLQRIANRLTQEVGEPVSDVDAAEDMIDSAPGQAAAAPGTVNSPQDVTIALDRIIAYYARHEPSSPLPILLERAKRLVGADFITIMNDLAPLGVDNVNLVGGITPDE